MCSRISLQLSLVVGLSFVITSCCIAVQDTETGRLASEFYVSQSGDDSSPGTKLKPFKTLVRAREAVRNIKWKQNKGDIKDIAVVLRGGRHYLTKTVNFDENDSGNYGYKIIYKNYPGENPVLVGGLRVSNWEPYRGNISKAYIPYLKAGIISVSRLIESGVPGIIARTPNNGWLRLQKPDRQSICYKADDLNPAKWDISQLQLNLTEPGTYFSDVIPVDNIEIANRRINLRYKPFYMPASDKTYFVQNSLALLDAPGEFFADRKTGYLYYWPRASNIKKTLVEIPFLENLFKFESYSPRFPVHDIVVEGLQFEGSATAEFTRRGWPDNGDNGHPNDEGDRQTALHSEHWGQVYFNNASRIILRDCRLTNAGVNAVSIVGASTDITVTGCEIAGAGYMGVYIKGDTSVYKKEQATGILDINNGHLVHNNYIHHYGRLSITGIGVNMCNTSRSTISNNLITDGPKMGISMFSQWDVPREFCTMRDNVIRNNELARCCTGSTDGGAFYIGASTENTVFENNRITDVWSWFNTTWPQPDDREDDNASIDFDPGMTFNTYIKNNLCYGENAAVVETGRTEDEMFLDNNYFEPRPGYLGKVMYNGQWVTAPPFDFSKVSMGIGLTSDYKLPYPKETIKPVQLPLRCEFERTLSPLFLYRYSDGPAQEFFTDANVKSGKIALRVDKDIFVVRYRHPSPVNKRAVIWIYDNPDKRSALCGASITGDGGTVWVGVDCSISREKYVLKHSGKTTITPMSRKVGWHELQMNLDSTGCKLSIDSQVVGKAASIQSFTILDMGDDGFGSDSTGMGFDSLFIE